MLKIVSKCMVCAFSLVFGHESCQTMEIQDYQTKKHVSVSEYEKDEMNKWIVKCHKKNGREYASDWRDRPTDTLEITSTCIKELSYVRSILFEHRKHEFHLKIACSYHSNILDKLHDQRYFFYELCSMRDLTQKGKEIKKGRIYIEKDGAKLKYIVLITPGLTTVTDMITLKNPISEELTRDILHSNKSQILYEMRQKKHINPFFGTDNDAENSYICLADKDRMDDFLALFYANDFIDDFIVDTLKAYTDKVGLPFDDFRLDSQKLIEFIQDNYQENLSADEFKTAAFKEINKIKHPGRRQRLCYDLAQDLMEGTGEKQLAIAFLKEIMDISLPFYAEARYQLAEHISNEMVEDEDKYTRLHKSIVCLLLPKGMSQDLSLNTKVKSFLFSDKLSIEPLHPLLQNLDVSAESVGNLLEYIRELHLELGK